MAETKKNKLTVQYNEMRFEAFQEKNNTYRCLILADLIPQSEKNELSKNDVISELSQLCPLVPTAILNFFVQIAMQHNATLKITRNNSMFIDLNDIVFIQYSATSIACTVGCKTQYKRFILATCGQIPHENVLGITLFQDIELVTASRIISELMSKLEFN